MFPLARAGYFSTPWLASSVIPPCSVRVRTTRGTIRPGIYGKGTPLKIVFRDVPKRRDSMYIFALPQSELTAEQLSKSPLLEGDIEWGNLSALDLGGEPTPGSTA